MTESPAQRNLAAERRGIEEGHYARVQPGGSILVASDTHYGKSYRVTFAQHTSGAVRFVCKPEGNGAGVDDHLLHVGEPGVVPCKHVAVAARRLEREGLAKLGADGLWRVTPKAAEVLT